MVQQIFQSIIRLQLRDNKPDAASRSLDLLPGTDTLGREKSHSLASRPTTLVTSSIFTPDLPSGPPPSYHNQGTIHAEEGNNLVHSAVRNCQPLLVFSLTDTHYIKVMDFRR
jgi:hypothetical protein